MRTYIRDTYGRIIINDNVIFYRTEGTSLVAFLITGESITLGEYSTIDNATVALNLLFNSLNVEDHYKIKNDKEVIAYRSVRKL